MRRLFLFMLITHTASGWAAVDRLRLGEALAKFPQTPEYQSIESTVRSIEFDFASRDLLLEPQLEIDAKRLNEHRLLISPVTKSQVTNVTAFLTKSFSTGTTLKLIPQLERDIYLNQDPQNRENIDWQVAITQDLWQDFLGRSTRLRWSRESFERRQQIAGALLQRAQLEVDFETLYWDWAMALRQRELQEKNVRRGQEILRWMRERFARSAAESTDVLQAEALLGTRRLSLLTIEQSLPIFKSQLQRFFPNATWAPDPDELAHVRDVDGLRTAWKIEDLSTPQKLELLGAQNAAQAAGGRAEEAREQIRPTLNVQAYYGKNGLDPQGDIAGREAFSETHEYSSVGFVFTTGLDVGLERKKVESARAARDSAAQHARALEADGAVAWPQLKSSVGDLHVRIEQARQLAQVQWRKADAERQRYKLGRSTAFQVITFEQDAADAEIALWNLFTSIRKLEAQARLFAR